ncbi:MAG: polymer-forming cytoskeletal protein, partial [Promethearchaeota archaeon]
VSGSARIDGDFECNGFKSSGSLRSEGNLTIHGDFRSSGSFRLNGSLYGDGDARSSGSASVGGELLIKGTLRSSGSIRVRDKLEAIQGIRSSGSMRVQGDVFSQERIDIEGSVRIEGNIKGNDIFIGTSLRKAKRLVKDRFRVYGNIFATNTLDITGTKVEGDVRGRNVRIGRGAEISGAVFYIDSIEVHRQATVVNEPIQIEVKEKEI